MNPSRKDKNKLKFTNMATVEPSAPTKNFGNWQIRDNGDLVFTPRDYVIAKDRLERGNWILHLSGKVWIDFNEFIPAYFQALRFAGIKKINIRTDY